jgi:hypothetical protein
VESANFGERAEPSPVSGVFGGVFARWSELKRKEGEKTVLLMRMGDFYEAFDDDAKVVASTCGLVITSRNGRPMAGVVAWSVETYARQVADAGHDVAIADEQVLRKIGRSAPTQATVASAVGQGQAYQQFVSREEAAAWMKANGIAQGSITQVASELYGLRYQKPEGREITPPLGWYLDVDDKPVFSVSSPDSGLRGPYSRDYIREAVGFSDTEIRNAEKAARTSADMSGLAQAPASVVAEPSPWKIGDAVTSTSVSGRIITGKVVKVGSRFVEVETASGSILPIAGDTLVAAQTTESKAPAPTAPEVAPVPEVKAKRTRRSEGAAMVPAPTRYVRATTSEAEAAEIKAEWTAWAFARYTELDPTHDWATMSARLGGVLAQPEAGRAYLRELLGQGRGANTHSKRLFFEGVLKEKMPSSIAGIEGAVDRWAATAGAVIAGADAAQSAEAPVVQPAPERAAVIERIVEVASAPREQRYRVVARRDVIGTDGKVYNVGGMPFGMRSAGMTEPFYVFESVREGTTHGKRYKTQAEAQTAMDELNTNARIDILPALKDRDSFKQRA